MSKESIDKFKYKYFKRALLLYCWATTFSIKAWAEIRQQSELRGYETLNPPLQEGDLTSRLSASVLLAFDFHRLCLAMDFLVMTTAPQPLQT